MSSSLCRERPSARFRVPKEILCCPTSLRVGQIAALSDRATSSDCESSGPLKFVDLERNLKVRFAPTKINMSLKSLIASRNVSKQLTHPYASYRGPKLSCSLCGTPIKHENLFATHLTTKAHRNKVAEEEKMKVQRSKVVEEEQSKKRRNGEENSTSEREGKRAKAVETDAIPADFFADNTQRPTIQPMEEDEPPAPIPSTSTADPTVDDEWAAFEATLSVPPPPTTLPSAPSASMFGAPVTYEFGAPKILQEGEEEALPEEEEEGETEEEKAERLDREAREEIMERIEKEERDQMEADLKVTVRRSLLFGSATLEY